MERWKRPDPHRLFVAFEQVFHSSTPLSKIKDASFNGRLFAGLADGEEESLPGRGMAWKLFLLSHNPLEASDDQPSLSSLLHVLASLRKEYTTLLLEKLRAPDGSYEEGLTIPGMDSLPRSSKEMSPNLQQNNPLSLHENNPWNDWFAAVELRRTIRQDVERTFPDIEYFREPEVQAQLTLILYVHSVTHPEIGYRQGMHELLAPVLYTLDLDSVHPEEANDLDLTELCSRTWVAADAWAIFAVIMEGVNGWYEWREPPPPSLPSPLKSQFRHGGPQGPVDSKPYVAPIVLACQQLQADFLKSSDPVLWKSLQKSGVEPQIYGIRWLRLLFTREFSLQDALLIWDGIFSFEFTFDLVPWICVAMLIRIRNQLIPSDYSSQLTFLLRYPPAPSTIDDSSPHHSNLLLRQAFALYTTRNPSTGASIMIENRNLLGLPLEVPEPLPTPQRRQMRSDRPRRTSSMDMLRSSKETAERTGASRQPYQIGFPEGFARGLMERGESLGINKTVMNAVTEIRKNLPDLANQLIRSPSASTSTYSSFPLIDERPPEERPPWEPRSRFEMEKEIRDLQVLQKRLGDAVSIAVDALLQDEGDRRDLDRLKVLQARKREAIESLAYVRDLLNGAASTTGIDDERLLGEDEYVRRRMLLQRQQEASSDSQASDVSTSPPLRAPAPVASVPHAKVDRQERQAQLVPNSHPSISLPRSPPVSRPAFVQTAASQPGRKEAMPRRGTTTKDPPPSLAAPWNHTPSNFSSSSPPLPTATLPRPPPRTSTTLRTRALSPATSSMVPNRGENDQASRHQKAGTDPLGALP